MKKQINERGKKKKKSRFSNTPGGFFNRDGRNGGQDGRDH